MCYGNMRNKVLVRREGLKGSFPQQSVSNLWKTNINDVLNVEINNKLCFILVLNVVRIWKQFVCNLYRMSIDYALLNDTLGSDLSESIITRSRLNCQPLGYNFRV